MSILSIRSAVSGELNSRITIQDTISRLMRRQQSLLIMIEGALMDYNDIQSAAQTSIFLSMHTVI